ETMKKEEKLYDIRTVKKSIKRGILSQQDYEKHIKSLEDQKNNCAETKVFEEETENLVGAVPLL
ncbi:MAG: hypothetical protein Q7S00_03300, partial [bacterium]|nr:hypothetical protein [bacterium]